MIALQPVHPRTHSRTRRTIVLLHSSASSARQWDTLSDTLRSTHDVHAIDLHGHGQRRRWTGGRAFTVHDDVALAVPLLERAGGGHVIGHSYGAAVALHLAVARPDLVHSLAMYEPVPFRLLANHMPSDAGIAEIVALSTRMRQLVGLGRQAEAAERFVDYWSGAGTWTRLKPERQVALAGCMPAVLQHFDTLYAEPLPATALSRLTMPVLCLHGTRSTCAARQLAALLQSLLQDARHEALSGLGHMGPISHAALVNERLLRFLHADAACHAPPTEIAA